MPSNSVSHLDQSLPKLSENGFLLTKLSTEDLELVNIMYESVRNNKVEEIFDHKSSIILGNNNTSDIMPLDTIPELRSNLHKKLQSTAYLHYINVVLNF